VGGGEGRNANATRSLCDLMSCAFTIDFYHTFDSRRASVALTRATSRRLPFFGLRSHLDGESATTESGVDAR